MERPDLFRQTLEGLAANDLSGWHVSIRIEPTPGARAFSEIAAGLLRAHTYTLVVNEQRRGIALNPYEAIEGTFAAGSRLNLHLEEDFVLSPDATQMALWYERNHRPGWLCLSLLAGPCGSAALLSNPQHPAALFEANVFNSIGFAVRDEEWRNHMRAAWPVAPVPRHAGIRDWRWAWGWDWAIYGMLNANPDLHTVQPVLARATHNGPQGANTDPDFHDRAFGGMPLHDGPAPDYRIVAPEDLPFEVRAHIRAFEESAHALCNAEKQDRRLHRPMPELIVRRLKYYAYRTRRRLLPRSGAN